MPRFFIIGLAIFAILSATPIQAQNARPGGTARGTTGGSTTGNRGGTNTGGNRSSSGGGARQYRSNTELGDATIQIDPETRSLVIVTDEETHGELMKVIQKLDQPKPQVLIKVVFLEVTYNNGSDVGIEANYTFNSGYPTGAITGNSTTTTAKTDTASNGTVTTTNSSKATDLSAAAILANGVTGGSIFGAATEGTFARILADDWSATIRALSTKGKVELLSRPSIMARNNQEAVIVVGSEVPFVTNSRTDNNGNIINTITYDNIGIILRVTPFITSEGTVEMIVAPEISSLTDQTVPISSNASAPVIAKRSAETVVVTPNAKTVVIGGLMETQHIESVKKIPLLGDIPYLGVPFRRTVKSDVKKELMIFLTPYIVNTPETLHHVTVDALEKTDLVEQAFTKRDFGKYLDDPSLFPETDATIDLTALPPAPAVKSPAARARTSSTTVAASISARTKPAATPKAMNAVRPANPKGR